MTTLEGERVQQGSRPVYAKGSQPKYGGQKPQYQGGNAKILNYGPFLKRIPRSKKTTTNGCAREAAKILGPSNRPPFGSWPCSYLGDATSLDDDLAVSDWFETYLNG